MSDRTCEQQGCEESPCWQVYAAYDAEGDSTHPRVARYPMPMAYPCNRHLSWALGRDAANLGSTCQWLIKPIAVPG
jgi:hypothetical protein